MKTKMKKYQKGGVSETGYDKRPGRIGQILGGVGAATIGTVGAIANKRRAKKLKAQEEADKKAAEKEAKSSTTKEMKRGGTMKKMQKGGAKKPLRKAQNGDTIIGTPSLKDVGVKNVYQGPLNKSDYENLNKLYPVNNYSPRVESTVMAPRVLQKDKSVMGPKARMSQSSGNEYMRNRAANYLRSGKILDNDGENVYAPSEKELYSVEGKKRGGTKKSIMKKGGTMKTKMKTGGMVNSNSKVSALKVAGSKGVKSGVNPKAAASKVAKGRSGGTSTAPITAVPKAKYGMTTKPTMKRSGSMKKK
jgi:hypothetical protein